MSNGRIRIVFDDAAGTVVSMRRLDGDHEYVRHEVSHSLFRLTTLREGEKGKKEWPPGRILSTVVRDEPDGKTMTIEAEGCGGGGIPVDVKMTVELPADGEEIVWKMDVHNRSEDHRVVEVLFPLVKGIALGDRHEDDVIVYPHHAGEKTVNPAERYASDQYLKFWRAESRKEHDYFYREINYCGLASMTWMYLYDEENGLYVGSHDPRFPVTGLRVETGGPSAPWMGFGFRKYATIRPGHSWHSHEYVFALNKEDWHWGARRYRLFIDPYLTKPEHPPFLEREALLNQCYHFKQMRTVKNRFRDIPDMYRKGMNELGIRHMFIASWNRSGFDQDYPEFQPDMELGTPMELYRGVQYVNGHGGFVTFYINARIFDVESDFFPTLGKRWAIKDDRQEMMPEQYGPYHFAVNCPSHREWQEFLIDTATWMVKSYGAKGVYLDQLGSASPYPCYDPEHSHGDSGQFNNGYVRVLREVLQNVRAIDADTFLMIENCGDIYGPYVWGNLTWNGEDYDEFFQLFKYTFPEYVQVNMVNPRRDLSGDAQRLKLHRDIARAVLLGSVLWIGFDQHTDPTDPATVYMYEAARFRVRLQPLIAEAVYLERLGIERLDDGLDASRWQMKGGGQLVIVSNLPHRAGCEITVPCNAKEAVRCEITDLYGNRREMTIDGRSGTVTLPVPATELSAIRIFD